MANPEHLKLLKQGSRFWNEWKAENSLGYFDVPTDLSGADLRGTNLSEFNLSSTNLSGADLSGANLRGVYAKSSSLKGSKLFRADLSGANLSGADLTHTNLSGTNLSGTNLSGTNLSGTVLVRNDLRRVNLSGAILSAANLEGANLEGSTLYRSNLSGANLFRANLSGANLSFSNLRSVSLKGAKLLGINLSGVDLSGTDLSGADLNGAGVLGTNFERTILTAACVENWNVDNATNFDNTICEYVYLKRSQKDRRPREGVFKPGEFAILFQQVANTIDLIFKDGIDWQAFFQSFQELRSQYADQNLSIQAIEKKRGEAFVVRVEVAEGADKVAIESRAKKLYETQLKTLEAQYERQLRLQGEQHSAEIQRMIAAERQEKATLIGVLTTMASNQGPKYDLSNAQFAGGFAETVQGDQIQTAEINNNQTFNGPVGNAAVTNYGKMSAIQNNYGANTEDITRLFTALRNQAQTFPTDQKDEANDALDDLERDLAEEQPDQGRISRRLKKLVALGAAIGTIASGAAAVSGDVSTFTGNVIELTEQLGIPVEQVQLPSSGTP
ncbi:MAG: pentapeptide repeat-containing protein [Cyanobacteria bacterium P01_F01_bin.42]